MSGLWLSETKFAELPAASSDVMNEIVTRKSAYDFRASMSYLPNPDPYLRKNGKAIDIYDELLYDAQVGCEIEKLLSGVQELEHDVDRGKARSAVAKAVQAWVKKFDLQAFMNSVLRARLYGYQPIEIMWTVRDNLIVPASATAKPQKWFAYDDENRLLFRSQKNTNGELVDAWPRKFLMPRHQETYENPYGIGVLAKCFWPVVFKRGGQKFWAYFTEKYGIPWIVIRVPESTSDQRREELLKQGQAMIQDAVAVINETDNLEIKEAGGKQASSDLFRDLCSFCDEQISKAISSQTLTSQIGSSGSYAASQTHGEVLNTAIKSLSRLVEQQMNILISWFCELNYGEIDPPTFILYEEEDVDKNLADRDKTLTDQGVQLSQDYYTRIYGFQQGDIIAVVPPQTATQGAQTPPVAAFADGGIRSLLRRLFADGGADKGLRNGNAAVDQSMIDELIAGLSDEELQAQAQQTLQPVIDLVNESTNFADLQSKIVGCYPDMTTDELENTLAKFTFIANAIGRIHADQK